MFRPHDSVGKEVIWKLLLLLRREDEEEREDEQIASTALKRLFSLAVAGWQTSDEENSIAARNIMSVALPLSRLFNFNTEDDERGDGRGDCPIFGVSMLVIPMLWKMMVLLRPVLALSEL